MLIAGKMMWAEIVNANCSRASTRTSLVWGIRLALLSQPHRSLLSRVHVQAEDIRPRVMANGIEIVLAAGCITHIDVAAQQSPWAVDRPRQLVPRPSGVDRCGY